MIRSFMTLVKAEMFSSENLQWCGSLIYAANIAGLRQINEQTLVLLRPNLITFSANITQMYSDIYIPGADYILAQPLKRCSASRIRPNETFELAKKRQNILCFGVCGRKNFFRLSPSCVQSSKNRERSLCSTVLEFKWVISTWWDENMALFVFSACYEIHCKWFCGIIYFKHSE